MATISGNTGVAGARVCYSNSGIGVSGSVLCDASGNFTTPALANDTYTLVPSSGLNSFSPMSSTQVVSGSNITGQASIGAPGGGGLGPGASFGFKFGF